MLIEKYFTLLSRKNPEVFTEIDKDNYKIKRKFLKCDYCGNKIFIDVPEGKRTGGITILSHNLTKRPAIKIALCNCCVKNVASEFKE